MPFQKITIKTLQELGNTLITGNGVAIPGQIPTQMISVPDDIPNEQSIGYVSLTHSRKYSFS